MATASKTPKTAAAKKPRPTAAERRAAEAARRAEAAAEQARRAEAFAAERPRLFTELFAMAMRLQLVLDQDPELAQANSWWFDDFGVDAVKRSFRLEEMGGTWVTEASLHPSDVERIKSSLETGWGMYEELLAARERKRREEEERREKIRTALAKLTADDIKVLGIQHLVSLSR